MNGTAQAVPLGYFSNKLENIKAQRAISTFPRVFIQLLYFHKVKVNH